MTAEAATAAPAAAIPAEAVAATAAPAGPKTETAAPAAAAVQQQPTGDAKTGDKPGEAKADGAKAEGDALTGAPEKYEDFKLPEGVKIDPEMMQEFTALAKDLKLNQADAQRATDLGAKLAVKIANKSTEIFQAAKASWIEASNADKEFGGDAIKENLAVAKKALDVFGTPQLREMLDQSGLEAHPEMIRLFWKMGKRISEDNKLVRGNGPTPDTAASAKLYPDQQTTK